MASTQTAPKQNSITLEEKVKAKDKMSTSINNKRDNNAIVKSSTHINNNNIYKFNT